MCLGVPGKIIDMREDDQGGAGGTVGTVDFQGSQMEVSLATAPGAKVGDWVLVHAGFALTVLDEDEAMETWKYLREAGLVDVATQPTQSEGKATT